MKPSSLIAIASGSSDVDVIVTCSVLRELSVKVTIASADGWSPVTLQNGLVIKPDCSLDRALRSQENQLKNPSPNMTSPVPGIDTYSTEARPFDIIILPDGDSISAGRLESHPKLSLFLKHIVKQPSADHQFRYIIAAGATVMMLQRWKLFNPSSSIFQTTLSNVNAWLIEKCYGSGIIYSAFHNENVQVTMCASAPEDDPLRTVNACTTLARKLLRQCSRKEELGKFGMFEACLLENIRNSKRESFLTVFFRRIFCYLRDNSQVPWPIRKWILSPTCASLEHRRHRAYHAGKLHPGLRSFAICPEEDRKKGKAKDSGLSILGRSSSYAVDSIWKFVQQSLKLRKQPLAFCCVAVLVNNRVNEDILAILVTELRRKFKISTVIVACDRSLLRMTDPFVITRGLLQIRSDAAIETVRPCFDVIITIDSEVEFHGPGMWYRKSAFDWQDFQVIHKTMNQPYTTCVTATFDTKEDGGKTILSKAVTVKHRRKRLNPLTNEWIDIDNEDEHADTDSGNAEGEESKELFEATFFRVCNKQIRTEDGKNWKERNVHDLVFQSFVPFHSKADMHTTISSEASAEDAIDFVKALTDCLRRVMGRKGLVAETIPEYSRCTIL